MITDANSKALPSLCEYGESSIVNFQEFASGLEKRRTPCCELHVPRCSFDEAISESLFEPLQLQADRGLRRPHSFSCARETIKFGNVYESLDGIQIEGGVYHFELLSLISIFIVYQNSERATNVKQDKWKGPAMPLLHISLRAGKPEAYRQAIFDGL